MVSIVVFIHRENDPQRKYTGMGTGNHTPTSAMRYNLLFVQDIIPRLHALVVTIQSKSYRFSLCVSCRYNKTISETLQGETFLYLVMF